MLNKTIAHYRALRKLGSGGTGVVYEAEDRKLGRRVAQSQAVDASCARREQPGRQIIRESA